jgi:hypothetical protein
MARHGTAATGFRIQGMYSRVKMIAGFAREETDERLSESA